MEQDKVTSEQLPKVCQYVYSIEGKRVACLVNDIFKLEDELVYGDVIMKRGLTRYTPTEHRGQLGLR
jgi:hypothetical protein